MRPRRKNAEALETLEASIAELAPGGEGVAIVATERERRAVFVRGAAAGDRVRVAVDWSRRPARGTLLEVVAAGPARVVPVCAYAASCGGCDWMHIDVAAQSDAHAALVRNALPEAWRNDSITSHAAREPLHYRSRARLHVRASGGRAVVGMHEAGTRDPIEVDACIVLDPALESARRSLDALLEGAHGTGDAQIAVGRTAEGVPRPVLELRWSGRMAAAVYARVEQAVLRGDWAGARIFEGDVQVARRHSPRSSSSGDVQVARRHSPRSSSSGDASRPAVVGDPTPWMTGFDGAPLRLPAGGFGQASVEANARLVRRVAELCASVVSAGFDRVVELYAGAGNLTVALAPLAHDLVAVESSRDACDAARANVAARGLSARIVEADASAYVWRSTTRLVVLDPPRAGARAVAARLAESPTRHVLYVSCDPQTLGRDLALLAPRYAPCAIETFEMFPQTSHVETVVLLERRTERGAR